MKRSTLLLTLLAILGVTAVAVAATPRTGTFKAPKGKVQLGYDLKFKVDKGGKRIKDVVANVLEDCGSGQSSTTTIAPDSTWKVKGGRFSGRKKETYENITTYYTLEGRFKNATTAVGTIRQESIVVGTGARCDTYKLKFTAKR